MLYGLAVNAYLLDALGMNIGIKLLGYGLKEHHESGHLNTAARTSRAGSDKH